MGLVILFSILSGNKPVYQIIKILLTFTFICKCFARIKPCFVNKGDM